MGTGHPVTVVAGDQALKLFAGICQQEIREQDFFGRVGGEEFALVLVETDGAEALTVINRILEGVRELSIRCDNQPFSITVSAGISALRDGDSILGDLMIRADNALYAAKKNGRDQAVLDA